MPRHLSRGDASPRTGSSAIPTSRPTRKSRPRRAVRLAAPGARRDRAVARADRRNCAGAAAAASASSSGRGRSPISPASAIRSSPATWNRALAAFQRRFRPERWDGRLDGETSGTPRRGRAALRCLGRSARSGQAQPLPQLSSTQLSRVGRGAVGRRATSCPAW